MQRYSTIARHNAFKRLKGINYSKIDEYDNNITTHDIEHWPTPPDDYLGDMGVPLTFLDRYCPEQFEIIGLGIGDLAKELGISKNHRGRTDLQYIDPESGKAKVPYSRILIRKKQ